MRSPAQIKMALVSCTSGKAMKGDTGKGGGKTATLCISAPTKLKYLRVRITGWLLHEHVRSDSCCLRAAVLCPLCGGLCTTMDPT